MVETEKKAKEEALAAKVNVEKKAREFVNDQKCTIEQLNKEKVRFTLFSFVGGCLIKCFCITLYHAS